MPAKLDKTKFYRPDFGHLLRSHLEAQRLGVREFARLIDDFDPGFLAGVLSGKRPPPLAQFPGWADVLKLTGEERDQFLRLGHLTHCQDYVWELVDALRAENRKLRKRLGE